MNIKLLIVAFCASLVCCGEIADRLLQEYVDMVISVNEEFRLYTDFLEVLAFQFGANTILEFQQLERQKSELSYNLEFLVRESRYNDSHVSVCLSTANEMVTRIIDGAEIRLQEISINENSFLREVTMDIEIIALEMEDFERKTNELIEFCDGVQIDYERDLCFSEQYSGINDPKNDIITQIHGQRSVVQSVFNTFEERLDRIKNDITEYTRTRLIETQRQLITCIENAGGQK